jgi:hypothetical protein
VKAGRVYEIVSFRQLFIIGEPATTGIMSISIEFPVKF